MLSTLSYLNIPYVMPGCKERNSLTFDMPQFKKTGNNNTRHLLKSCTSDQPGVKQVISTTRKSFRLRGCPSLHH